MTAEHPTVAAELDARLAALPAEEAPARDLWPGILEAISVEAPMRARPWTRGPFALAASVALAVSAGFAGWLGGRQAGDSSAAGPVAAGTPDAAMRQASFAVPAGRDYLATRSELERAYHERLAQLAPATRLRVEHDLALVRAANEDIRRALAAEPQSPVLNRLLDGIWQQEFDLYATVARSTDPAAQRTRT
jgi:hypothetical protein